MSQIRLFKNNSGSLTGAYIPLSGGTVTGQLNFTSLSAASASGYFNANSGFIFELRTSDPISPEIGRAWFRSDL